MGFTKELIDKAEYIWKEYLNHPFLIELSKGTLPKEKFKYYLIQDYLYLKEYSKVFCMGVIKSNDMKEMKFFYNSVKGTMEDETAVHIEYMKDLKIEPEEAEKYPYDLTTSSYTSYMKAISLTEGIKDIAVTTLSCTLSYGYIGKSLKKIYNNELEDNYYKKWIDMYDGKEFTIFCEKWTKYIDMICENISEEEKLRLEEIFIKCSIYEMEFWNMAYKER